MSVLFLKICEYAHTHTLSLPYHYSSFVSIFTSKLDRLKTHFFYHSILAISNMGNWRRVRIQGTCDSQDLDALQHAIAYHDDGDNFHCLTNVHSICGLNNWAAMDIFAEGNLAERDFTVEDVADQLKILADQVPSLNITVHCGDDYEALNVIASVVLAYGVVTIHPPQIQQLDTSQDEHQFTSNMIHALNAAAHR